MIKRSAPYAGLLHEVVEHNGTLYLAGLVAEDLSAGIDGQAADCMKQLATLLAAHGSSLAHVLQVTVYLRDLKHKPAFDLVWKQTFDAAYLPARAGIGVADLGPRVLVEMMVIAATIVKPS